MKNLKLKLQAELEEINQRNRDYIFDQIQEENLKQGIADAERMAAEYFNIKAEKLEVK